MQFYVPLICNFDYSYIDIMYIFTICTMWCVKISYCVWVKRLVKLSCRKVSMTITSLSMHGSFIYQPFLAKICSSWMQLTMNSDAKILSASQMFTSLSLPVGSETSSCLVPINLTILILGMCFASQFCFY